MNDEDDELYQEKILDHYESPFHKGHCQRPTHGHERKNPLCGDVVRIDLAIDEAGRLNEAFFDGDGCCISQAAASMLMERIDGKSVAEVKEFTARDMLELFGVRLTPNRQKCCLLAWQTLQQAIHSPVCSEKAGGEKVGGDKSAQEGTGP